MKNIILSSSLLVGLISEFSLGGILNQGIGGIVQDAGIFAYAKLPPMPTFDNGKIVFIYPNYMGETLEETEQRLPEYISFDLYTRQNPKHPQKLYLNDTDSLKNSYFDPQKPTSIFVHGWIQTTLTFFSNWTRDSILEHADNNVILVDWERIARNQYSYTRRCVPMVSKYFSRFINRLVDHGANASQVHVIGHSLGAHIAGLGARFAKIKVPYAVGLDPAYPGFEKAVPGERLSKEDADYVQVIHTSGGHLGFPTPLGHSDFFINGGVQQPLCELDLVWFCSHFYALFYYGASINEKKGFWSRKCDNYDNFKNGKCHSNPAAVMALDEPRANVTGVYYLDTSEFYPYALGLEGISDK